MMHKKWMLAALEQAWLGRGRCAPNPSVGAVLVHHQQIIAKSFHPGAGSPHAEQLVLAQLPPDLSQVTLYVTLEPCNHWGKTPPCVEAIIQHGIESVVFGFHDPNPVVVQNDTPTQLAAHGIDVLHYPLPEVDAFYQSYQYWFRKHQPWVTAKIAQSLDGKIADASGAPVQLSNAECTRFTHNQRLHTDVLMTTAKTILADNPALNVRLESGQQGKPLAILDRQLQLTGDEQVFEYATVCHIFHDAKLTVSHPLKQVVYHPIATQHDQLDLLVVMKVLGSLGYHDVWVEAGGRLFTALHDLKLVNTSYFYLVPKLLGDSAVSAYHNDRLFENKKIIHWQALADNMLMKIDWLHEEVND